MTYNIAIERLLDEMPQRFRTLPISPNGFPVPKFVEWIDGAPDFRVADMKHMQRCVEHKRCWLCAEPLGVHLAFVIGPMCAVNRTTSEPPSHLECARFAVKACPFMVNPNRKRDQYTALPADAKMPAGLHLDRNPGAYLIWVARDYRIVRVRQRIDQPGGVLFKIGEPSLTEWYAQGRTATRDEIMVSITSGLPFLRNIADDEGPDARRELEHLVGRALKMVPA